MLRFVFLMLLTLKLAAQPKWKSFSDSVFIKAKSANKPVLLHLRANWCHWCHVMEEETYSREKVSNYLDKNFIACNEDHDARPDLTARYFEYGWPATIIFDKDGNELFKQAGYIEEAEFLSILQSIKNGKLKPASVVHSKHESASEKQQHESLNKLKDLFYNSLDTISGGFHFGQKYIDFETYEYALNHYQDKRLAHWLQITTENSAGINDPVWGGVFQYSTHNDWNHVHFEKLLSAQAKYIKAYCWYYQLSGNKKALLMAEKTAEYVNRFLRSGKGAYYNSQDADLTKGEKATVYFALSDKERMQQGIPSIDSSIYTNENAMLAESMLILWASTGNETYYGYAEEIINYLQQNHSNSQGAYYHGKQGREIISLNDNIYMAKALLMMYRVSGDTSYLRKTKACIDFITTTFNSSYGYYYNYSGKAALPPSYNISENIELARVLNLVSYYEQDKTTKQKSVAIISFLLGKEAMAKMYTEPGLISASEEIKKEPLSALYFSPDNNHDAKTKQALISAPLFYVRSVLVSDKYMPEDKAELFEGFDANTVFFCTENFCSSPLRSSAEVEEFLHKSVLEADKK